MTDTVTPEVIAPEERFNVTAKFIESLMAREYERGKRDGENDASRIQLDNGYDTSSALVVLRAPSRRALSRRIDERRWRREGDNPGQAYAGTCQLLKRIRQGKEWVGIVICSVHYDV